jgi:hypothetical protein
MFFTLQKPRFPTTWKTWFAFWPVQIGEDGDRKIYTWLARYEARRVSNDDVERRSPAHTRVQLSCKVFAWWA